jgi:lysophospholipase L1-like esterase
MPLPLAAAAKTYVALGDSMSIDAYAGGPGRGAASLLYRNLYADFPEWDGKDLISTARPCRFVNLTMDGATAATVRYAQLPRLRETGARLAGDVRPDLITLTVGGNDLLQTFGSDDAARAALHALREDGGVILSELRRIGAPGRTSPANAPLLIGTIYDPSDGTGDTARLGILPWPGALDWIARFNEALRALAAEHGGLVADIHGHFLGHGLRAGDPAQWDARPANRDLWYCGTIEPNAWGASAIRGVFYETLAAAGAWPPGATP